MADWYVSSVAYAAVAQFAASHAYSLGDIVRQRGSGATQTITTLTSVTTTATATVTAHGFVTGQSVLISGATQTNYNKQTTITVTGANTFTYTITATTSPATGSPVVFDFVAAGNERCWRCSTAGTSAASEPAWTLTKASTTTSSGATFTECSGNSSHQRDNGVTTSWTAPLARLVTGFASGFAAGGDRLFVSSDHNENWTIAASLANAGSAGANLIRCYSVSKAGSIPPVAADLAAGATVGTSGSIINLTIQTGYYEGFTFIVGSDGGSYQATMTIADTTGTTGDVYLKNCACQLLDTGASGGNLNCAALVNRCVFDNTTVRFDSIGGSMQGSFSGVFEWRNTPSAIQGATIPTTLFSLGSSSGVIECRGVDFTALGSGKTLISLSGAAVYEVRFSDCQVSAAGALTSGTVAETPSRVDFINVDSGATGYVNQWNRYAGTITTDTTLTRTNGATDGTQKVSHKYASSTFPSKPFPLEGPPIFAWNSTTGSAVTATIEILSGTALLNDDIWVEVEYLGSSSVPLSSRINDTVATSLTTAATQSTSAKTFADWSADCFDPNNTTVTTLSAANRTATKNAASSGGVTTICYFASGKVYWEVLLGSVPASIYNLGFANASYTTSTNLASTTNSLGYAPSTGAVKINNSTLSTIQTAGNGDVVGFAVDLTNSKVWIRKGSGNWNNAAIGSQDPANNVGGISLSTLAAGPYNAAFFDSANSSVATFNGGSSAFTAAAPTGFSAINTFPTQNLAVTFTPQMAGLVRVLVKLAKVSTAVYVDPLLIGVA